MINDMGIQVMEEAPDADDLLLAETSNNTDEDAEEAAAQVLSSVESEIGRTTDRSACTCAKWVPLNC